MSFYGMSLSIALSRNHRGHHFPLEPKLHFLNFWIPVSPYVKKMCLEIPGFLSTIFKDNFPALVLWMLWLQTCTPKPDLADAGSCFSTYPHLFVFNHTVILYKKYIVLYYKFCVHTNWYFESLQVIFKQKIIVTNIFYSHVYFKIVAVYTASLWNFQNKREAVHRSSASKSMPWYLSISSINSSKACEIGKVKFKFDSLGRKSLVDNPSRYQK